MNKEDRASLAEQLLANPLFGLLLTEMEHDATQICIWSQDDDTRRAAAMRVQAIQNLRTDCEASLRSNQARKDAPA